MRSLEEMASVGSHEIAVRLMILSTFSRPTKCRASLCDSTCMEGQAWKSKVFVPVGMGGWMAMIIHKTATLLDGTGKGIMSRPKSLFNR